MRVPPVSKDTLPEEAHEGQRKGRQESLWADRKRRQVCTGGALLASQSTRELWWHDRSPSISGSSDPALNDPHKGLESLFPGWMGMRAFGKGVKGYSLCGHVLKL